MTKNSLRYFFLGIFLMINSSFFLPIHAIEPQAFILKGYSIGFFANFCLVLGALESFEQGNSKGIQVSFNQYHCYYDELKGPNWWNYYFEPLQVGELSNALYPKGTQIVEWMQRARGSMPRRYAHYLISKYIKIKPELLQELDQFCNLHNFKTNHLVGVHYRGTDKMDTRTAEASFISYYEMLEYMNRVKVALPKSTFFVATDEQGFLDAAISRFGNDVIYREQMRSTTDIPPHNMAEIPNYIKGKDALMDCLLLSKCKTLIRTSSNLSYSSVFFNPEIEVVNVNYPDNQNWKNN